MSRYFNRVLLVCLMTSATVALIGLTALAGIAGFGFGVTLLIVGGVGFSVADDVWDEWDDQSSGSSTPPGITDGQTDA